MTELRPYLLPAIELIGVIVAAVTLVSVLVGTLVAVLRGFSGRGAFASYPLLLATRILTGRRHGGRGILDRMFPVSAQNFIAMVGTAVGVWALVVVLSVMGGFESDLKGKIVRNSPHVLIEPATPPENAAGWALLVEAAGAVPHVTAAEPFVDAEAMITSAFNMSPGLTLHGVAPGGALEKLWLSRSTTPAALRALAEPARMVVDRELGFARPAATAAPGDAVDGAPVVSASGDGGSEMPPIPTSATFTGRVLPGILIGEELARSLSVSPGDEVTMVVPDGDVGPLGVKPLTRVFRVAGTFLTGMYEYDLRTAYLTDRDAEALFLMAGPNRVAVMVDDIDHLESVSAGVAAAIAPLGGGEIRTVAQTNRSLFSALMVEKIAMFLVLGLVILVAAFNVFGSLLLITMERTRDIAIVQSLGATRRGIATVFLALGGSIGLVGTLAGLILGLGTCAYILGVGIRLPAEYYLRTLPVEVRPWEILAVAGAALGSGLLATLYPAASAAGLSPSEGLRND